MQDQTSGVTGKSVDALIEEALDAIVTILDETTETPHTRELRAKANSYVRIVKAWATQPASSAQREAMFDLVTELHTKVRDGSSKTPRRPVRKPTPHG